MKNAISLSQSFGNYIGLPLIKDIPKYNQQAFINFPVGTIIYFKREKIFGKVTAHGYSLSYGHTPLLGIKVPGILGSALLYNREVFASELVPIKLKAGLTEDGAPLYK